MFCIKGLACTLLTLREAGIAFSKTIYSRAGFEIFGASSARSRLDVTLWHPYINNILTVWKPQTSTESSYKTRANIYNPFYSQLLIKLSRTLNFIHPQLGLRVLGVARLQLSFYPGAVYHECEDLPLSKDT